MRLPFGKVRAYVYTCVVVNPEGTRFAGDDLVTTALTPGNNDVVPAVSGRLALVYKRINLCEFHVQNKGIYICIVDIIMLFSICGSSFGPVVNCRIKAFRAEKKSYIEWFPCTTISFLFLFFWYCFVRPFSAVNENRSWPLTASDIIGKVWNTVEK